jgi:membrane-bound inhibitor of C-type lysozyme
MRKLTALTALVIAALAVSPASAADAIASVTYTCAGGKTIAATYYSDRVDLVLGDGRTMTLPQAMAASGIRYANADETFVFWSKGKTAFVTEGKAADTTYADCAEH